MTSTSTQTANPMTSSPAKRIAVKLITITRAEGPTHLCTTTRHLDWASAEKRIMDICYSCESTMKGYYKCDFVIEWENLESYKGRFDATHPDNKHFEKGLAIHVRSFCEYSAGLSKPSFMTDAEYHTAIERSEENCPGFKQSALDILTKYSFCDEPVRQMGVPDALPATLGDEHKSSGPVPTIDPAPKLDATTQKGPTMATTSTQTATTAPIMSARESHDKETAINNGKPLIPVPGNSFPVKGVLFSWGGKFDSKTKTWALPAHRHAEAVALVAKYDKPVKAPSAAPAPKAPPTATAAPVKVTPVVKAKGPAPKLPPTAINRRLEALLTGAAHLLVDVKGTSAEGALYSVVQILEGIVPGK